MPAPEKIRHFKLVPAAKAEFAALEPAGRIELAAAMKRYEKGRQFKREVKKLTSASVTDSAGKRYALYEIRVNVGNNPFRLLFAHVGRSSQLCLGVTAIYKNQQDLPKEDRDRALDRLKSRLR